MEQSHHRDIVAELIEFFEIAVHVILYQRNVYPSELFKCVKKYEITARQSRHPQLNEYIAKALMDGILPFLLQGTLTKFVVVISNAHTQRIMEKFVFDLQILIAVGKGKSMKREHKIQNIKLVRRKLRDLLVKLNAINSHLVTTAPSHDGNDDDELIDHDEKELTFTIQAHTKSFDAGKHDQWIERDAHGQQMDDYRKARNAMVPIKDFRIEPLKMTAMVIQSETNQFHAM